MFTSPASHMMTGVCKRAWVHAQGLYPEDGDDRHGSMYADMGPILAPTRAEARPVFTREVSAERGVRLPGGSRLQGVTRVSIYLSEDPAYDAKPEAEKVISCHVADPSPPPSFYCSRLAVLLTPEAGYNFLDDNISSRALHLPQAGMPLVQVGTGKPNASELLAIAEKLCERTASKREADLDRDARRPRRGAAVDMSVVMRRVAMARVEIADRDRLATVLFHFHDHQLKWLRLNVKPCLGPSNSPRLQALQVWVCSRAAALCSCEAEPCVAPRTVIHLCGGSWSGSHAKWKMTVQMADEEEEEEDDEYERSGVTVPVADASDHNAALLATMASSAFLTPPSLPTPLAYPTSHAHVPTGQSCVGPGGLWPAIAFMLERLPHDHRTDLHSCSAQLMSVWVLQEVLELSRVISLLDLSECGLFL